MYLEFYGFQEKPFNLTPDPRFIFLSKNHKEAFAHLLYGINNRVGFIALTGEVGSGKTTVLRSLLSQLETDHHRTALIFNPFLSPSELIQSINREFGISTIPNDASPLDALNLFLLQQNAEDRTVVLVIDEAQDLEPPVLEQIRLISNLETDRDKLIQIILAGQPEFINILERKEMRQLNQRITVRHHLKPLDFEDTVAYINHRLEVAGGGKEVVFSKGALREIYKYSRGLPRLINVACDRALLAGYTKDTMKINSRIAASGIKDLIQSQIPYPKRGRLIIATAVAILLTLFVADIYFTERQPIHQLDAPPLIDSFVEEPKIEPAKVEEPSLIRAMETEFREISESESARRAFNVLTSLWKVEPVNEKVNLGQFREMERVALTRNLRLYRFYGNLGALLRLHHPAVLELNFPDLPGKRFIAMVGVEGKQIRIDPPIGGKDSITFAELEKNWSGRSFIPWRDPLRILPRLSPEAVVGAVKQLQWLLKEAGVFDGPATGLLDDYTIYAVKKFQALKGIDQDGIVGGQTLMLLYRSSPRFEAIEFKVVE